MMVTTPTPASGLDAFDNNPSPARTPTALAAFEPSSLLQLLQQTQAQFAALTPNQRALASAVGASSGTALIYLSYRKWWRRIPTADFVLPRMTGGKTWIKGVVTSVGDGDNFRLFHTPGMFYRFPPLRRVPIETKALRGQTIHIRISGVDAPEAAHFGRPAQPLSAEALQYLKDKIEGRRVNCLLYQKDQYNRVVALVTVPRPWLPFLPAKPLPLMMLEDGWAMVYKNAGAEYGHIGLAAYEAAEAEAKKKKRGIWSLGSKLEKPDAYKRRMQSGDTSEQAVGKSSAAAASGGLEGSILDTARKDGWWAACKQLMTE